MQTDPPPSQTTSPATSQATSQASSSSPDSSTAAASGLRDHVPGASRDGRVLAVDVFADTLDEQIPPGETVVEGDPRAAVSVLGELGVGVGTEVGVWEMTPGTATDVEADEVFVVLSGRATLTFDAGESLELRPGAVVRLHEGERTTWTVHETLRKIYLTPATPAP